MTVDFGEDDGLLLSKSTVITEKRSRSLSLSTGCCALAATVGGELTDLTTWFFVAADASFGVTLFCLPVTGGCAEGRDFSSSVSSGRVLASESLSVDAAGGA